MADDGMADCATKTERETEDDCTVISKESSLGIEAPTDKRKRARCFSPEKKGNGDRRIWRASMYNTKCNRDWTKQFPCIIADDASQHHFRCTVRMRTISCAHQGLTDVSRHCEIGTHKKSYRIPLGFLQLTSSMKRYYVQK
ncbi:hypothetical protein EMCRGX_G000123 [Ephydatia muelleri]